MTKKRNLASLKRKLRIKQAQLENALELDEDLLKKRNESRERAEELREKKKQIEEQGQERIEKLRKKIQATERGLSKKIRLAEKRSTAADLRARKIDDRFEIIEQKTLDLQSDIEEIEEWISALDED